MSKFFGKIAASSGNGVEVVQLNTIVSNLVKKCDQEFEKYASSDELTVSQATEFESELFANLMAQYDKKAAAITGKAVPGNWNNRGENASKDNSAVRKRILHRDLEKRTATLHQMFLASNETSINTVNEAFKLVKDETVGYYEEIRDTLPMQAKLLTSLITKKHEESIERALETAGGLDNINKVVRLLGDQAVTFDMFGASLHLCENETRLQNTQLIEKAKDAELRKLDGVICEAVRKTLETLAVQQEMKHFTGSEFTYLSDVEKAQFEQLLVVKIREKQSAFGSV